MFVNTVFKSLKLVCYHALNFGEKCIIMFILQVWQKTHFIQILAFIYSFDNHMLLNPEIKQFHGT